ncbi:MAG TPA: 6-pyruvoyl-tetrahydropterin synthase-related protein [Candidatus Woesebacteria bacterium]|nr:6-pyruvoyl-tetrahydropterin synthase-related protein [Candidatus Woesebacteria bacterium]
MKLFDTKLIKTAIFVLLFVSVIIVVCRNINPFGDKMFTFHDETQVARIQDFTLNLLEGQIPPRISPNFSFGMGYPLFNFYAPFSYWITSAINLIGFDVIDSLQISIILAIITAFIGMHFLMKQYISFYGSLLSSVIYTVSPYIAVEIFVRGNLAELWFYALFPWALYVLITNTKKRLLLSSLIISFLFTSHNVLSLVSVLIVIVFGLLQKNKKLNIISIICGLLLSTYFLLPALAELNSVYASKVASSTKYYEHFLCINQIWTGVWGFAGSAPGCEADGMSFMLGKVNILLGSAGLISILFSLFKKKKFQTSQDIAFIALLLCGSIFMITKDSSFIWQLTESISSTFQFPWRLLIFILFGFAFFGGSITKFIPKQWIMIVICILSIGILYTNFEYFYGNTLSKLEYKNKYLSNNYIQNEVAYKVAEYLPITADYNYWRSLEDTPEQINITNVVAEKDSLVTITTDLPFKKQFIVQPVHNVITLHIHYAPYWIIKMDETFITPQIKDTSVFDNLGRPIIKTAENSLSHFTIIYKQTVLEQIANSISLVSLLALTLYTVTQFKPVWKKTMTKKH